MHYYASQLLQMGTNVNILSLWHSQMKCR